MSLSGILSFIPLRRVSLCILLVVSLCGITTLSGYSVPILTLVLPRRLCVPALSIIRSVRALGVVGIVAAAGGTEGV